MIKRSRLTCLILSGLMLLPGPAAAQEQKTDEALPPVEVSPLVRALIDDDINTDAQRTELRIFHGQWEALPDAASLSADQRAELALLKYQLDDPSLKDASVNPLWRARAALLRGEPQTCVKLLADMDSAQSAVLLAQAYEQLGDVTHAVEVLRPWRERLLREPINDAAELTAAARALTILARLEGRPAQDYQLALNLLGRVREELDPAYWPAMIAEADLLIEKDNVKEGLDALSAALALNPQCSEAWERLGRVFVKGYSFDLAGAVIEKLREINPSHPLADLLEARSLLKQRDVAGARGLIVAGLSRYPAHREWLALNAAAMALSYDQDATSAAIKRFEKVSPGNPLAAFTVGEYLSMARQYDQSEKYLRRAVELAPNWPRARIELGLMLLQASKDEAARQELQAATRLDPFNRRASNQLAMLNELLSYDRIETEHFEVRYKPGIDEALARDMPEKLESIYRDITKAFSHEPRRLTRIDLMPDEQYFAVRITGLPDIWTIAAATGDSIAMTPPREGGGQKGWYDWPNVIRHEFVHTVTLDQTRNRVPHWFTEACAVSQELEGRSFDTCRLLAEALQHDKLFTLENINWGFIRPKSPTDRPLAYAQSAWMLEYIEKHFGHQAIVDMLTLYNNGTPDIAALEQVTGQPREAFMSGFKAWAGEQVASWGLETQPAEGRLAEVLSGQGEPADDDELATLLKAHPGHVALLRLIAERAIAGDDDEAAQQAVTRYAKACPVDPWPHEALIRLALKRGDMQQVIGSLSYMDKIEPSSGRWAHELAKAYRAAGRYDEAQSAIERALDREPYNAGYRELAAAIALQRHDDALALRHVYAASLIEPERAQHQVRLAALYQRMGRLDEADAAARRALALDPDSPAKRFLETPSD